MIYLITFSCYGTHLPGDLRGSYDHVRQGERRFIAPTRSLVKYAKSLMTQDAYQLLEPGARSIVRDAIVDVCRTRAWNLLALHVRITHVHGLVETVAQPGRILNDWKAYATRALRAQGVVREDGMVWGHSGHWREIRSQSGVNPAIRYVLECQGEPMERYRRDKQ